VNVAHCIDSHARGQGRAPPLDLQTIEGWKRRGLYQRILAEQFGERNNFIGILSAIHGQSVSTDRLGEKNCIPMTLPQSATFHIQIDERKMNAGLDCQNTSVFKH
jgi:hypothetical protein